MSSIVNVNVKIRGTRPILWHAFGPSAIPLEKQERRGVAGNDPSEWRKTVLFTKDGQLYVRPTYVFGCLREAARYTKKGRGSIQKLVAATLLVEDDRVLFDRFIPGVVDGELPDELTTDVPNLTPIQSPADTISLTLYVDFIRESYILPIDCARV